MSKTTNSLSITVNIASNVSEEAKNMSDSVRCGRKKIKMPLPRTKIYNGTHLFISPFSPLKH